MVFYRKYRSQTIAELDLESVRIRLTALLSGTEIPHALLFTGPKGLGKTSSARILAKAINCEKIATNSVQLTTSKNKPGAINIEPCNQCDICISVTNGSNLDVIEIDAASNRGIDEIRTLRERIKFAPSAVRKKVYIIDEVHMLTNEAFNALLKTLEEPPDHVLFVLCTTEADKLPATIRSRVFAVNFQKPTKEEIRHSLERVIAGEKLTVDDDLFDDIFLLSDGAFRDAHKIMEELSLSVADGHITREILENLYKTRSTGNFISSLFVSLHQKNAQDALGVIAQLADQGADFRIVTEQVVEKLRLQLLEKVEKGGKSGFTVAELRSLVDLFNTAYKDIRTSVLPQLPLELAVIEWIAQGEEEHTAQDSKTINPIPVVADTKNTEVFVSKPSVNTSKQAETTGNPNSKEFLYQLIDSMKKDNQTVAGLLRSCTISPVTGSTMKIVAPFEFHKSKLSDKKNLDMIQESASRLLNKTIQVEVVLAN